MIRGINAGFGERIGHTDLAALRARGVQTIRQDLALAKDEAAARDVVAEGTASLFQMLYIVRPDQLSLLPAGAWAELTNEPNLQGWTVGRYATAASLALIAAKARGIRLFIGSISNLGRREQDWLQQILLRCPHARNISVHRYPPRTMSPTGPQDGYHSRLEEMAALTHLLDGRAWIVTEFGYHSARFRPGWWPWHTKRLTESEVVFGVKTDLEYWAGYGAEACYLYQFQDGPTDTPINRYGIRTADLRWKPVADVFA